jgi:monovalent cation:H+ antiporter-2, CPA2 family
VAHELDLVLTLTGALTAALALGLLARKVGLSPIVGYLLAGVVVGPFTPGFVAHGGVATQFAELGVILLMFGVGLNLHVDELLSVRRVAVPGALVAMLAAAGGGVLVGTAFGWSLRSGVVYGLAIAVASTVVLLRVFADKDLLQTRAGNIAIGWLLVEDFFVVLVIVLLPLVTSTGGSVLFSIVIALAKLAALGVFTLVVGRRVIPRVLAFVASTRSRELFTLAVLVIALVVAVGAAKLFGASMALGAFLAGIVVGQSDFASRAASEALPMRDAFAVVFFVATGMQLDPADVLANIPLTLATLAAVWLAKPTAAFLMVRALRYPPRVALSIAFGLGQIGEFSFLVAALGKDLGLLPAYASQALVAAAIVSITVNPLLVGAAERWARRFRTGAAAEEPPIDEAEHRAIVIGYGPVGQSVTRLLSENGIEPVVIELNHETIATLRAAGIRGVYGDASQAEILERAGIASASSLVFTASGSPDAVIRMAKAANPELVVLARALYVREIDALRNAGATEVVSAEGEVALAMVERLLTTLGATPEQLDRARDRVRTEMLTSP